MTGSLVTNLDCKDMFYFDEQGHMIHLNTGQCVRISDSDDGLVTDPMSCDLRFSSDSKSRLYTIHPERCVLGGTQVQISNGACGPSVSTYEFVPHINYESDYTLHGRVLFFFIMNLLDLVQPKTLVEQNRTVFLFILNFT